MDEPTPEQQRAFFAELTHNAELLAETAERNPWIHEWRRVKAEHDRAGDDKLFEDFERRFKQDEARRYSSLK